MNVSYSRKSWNEPMDADVDQALVPSHKTATVDDEANIAAPTDQEIVRRIEEILHDKGKLLSFLGQKNEDAQIWLDRLQQVCLRDLFGLF